MLSINYSVYEPTTMQSSDRDPRYIAIRAENYMRSTAIADQAYTYIEPEFFLFDDVRFNVSMNKASFFIDDITR